MPHSDKTVEEHKEHDMLMVLAERIASRNRKVLLTAEFAIALVISTFLFWTLSQDIWRSEGMAVIDFVGIVVMATSLFVIEHLTYSDAGFLSDSREIIGLDLRSRLRFLFIGMPLLLLVLFASIDPEGGVDTHSVALGMGLIVFPAVAVSIFLDNRERRFNRRSTD